MSTCHIKRAASRRDLHAERARRAWLAPWPLNGDIGCAASPSSVTRHSADSSANSSADFSAGVADVISADFSADFSDRGSVSPGSM